MSLPRHDAAIYLTPLREGGSLPAVVEATDGSLWVVKFRGAGQGPRALIAEVLVAELAEDEGHHPDLHLTGYRNVAIELWTHAIGGLSENDFITAAKIDQLPIVVQKS